MTIQTLSHHSSQSYPPGLILSLLHSPSDLINLNPLVIHHQLLLPSLTPSPATTTTTSTSDTTTHYTITDSLPFPLPFFPLYSTTTTYSATFSPHSTGTHTTTHASFGITTTSSWSIDKEGKVKEEGRIEGPWSLLVGMGVGKVWRKAHAELMEAMEGRLKGMRKEGEGEEVRDSGEGGEG